MAQQAAIISPTDLVDGPHQDGKVNVVWPLAGSWGKLSTMMLTQQPGRHMVCHPWLQFVLITRQAVPTQWDH